PPAESVQVMEATFEGSVALTLPRTGTASCPLNQPLVPNTGEANVTVTAGAVLSSTMDQGKLVADPVVPAASTASTWDVWGPAANPLYALGLVHVAKAPASSLHRKWSTPEETPPPTGSFPVNAKLAEVLLLGFDGLEVIVAVGAVRSIVKERDWESV